MAKNIIEAAEVPLEEKVYLKKSFDGWRVVHPIRNEDGSMNYPNLLFGGWWGLAKLIGIMFVMGLLWLGINELIGNYKIIADNPCDFCKTCQEYVNRQINNINSKTIIPSINYTQLNEVLVNEENKT